MHERPLHRQRQVHGRHAALRPARGHPRLRRPQHSGRAGGDSAKTASRATLEKDTLTNWQAAEATKRGLLMVIQGASDGQSRGLFKCFAQNSAGWWAGTSWRHGVKQMTRLTN